MVGKDNSFDQTFRRKLKRLVKIFNLEENFTFLDWLEDTAPLLSALDLFVSPSHSESFGLAILEAMVAGNAIVATETAGAKELINNDFSGKLVSLENPVKLAEAVCEVLEDLEKSSLFGKNAQEFARENYSLEKMILETEKIYHSIIS
jgi:glycosyltransferase involved in cell wall biosynthesis